MAWGTATKRAAEKKKEKEDKPSPLRSIAEGNAVARAGGVKAQFQSASIGEKTPEGKDITYSTPAEAEENLARLNLARSGNTTGLEEFESNLYRNKYIDELMRSGLSAKQISEKFMKRDLPTSLQTAEVPPEQQQLSEAEMNQTLLNAKMSNPYKEGYELISGYKNPIEQFTSGYDKNNKTTTQTQATAGMYQLLDSLTSKVGLKGLTRAIKIPDTLSVTQEAWSNEEALMKLKIQDVRDGKISAREVIGELVATQNAVIQMEGYVNGMGREDPNYAVKEGISLQSELRLMQEKYDNIKEELLLAQTEFSQNRLQIQANQEAMKQEQITKTYGLK